MHVTPVGDLGLGQRQREGRLEVVISVEHRKAAVVDLSAGGRKRGNDLDRRIFVVGAPIISHHPQEVAKAPQSPRIGLQFGRLTEQHDSALQISCCRPDFCEAGEGLRRRGEPHRTLVRGRGFVVPADIERQASPVGLVDRHGRWLDIEATGETGRLVGQGSGAIDVAFEK